MDTNEDDTNNNLWSSEDDLPLVAIMNIGSGAPVKRHLEKLNTQAAILGGDASPEKCAICLSVPQNRSYADRCFHQFCFICLLEWSKIKAQCPLCKQPMSSIIYNVRSMSDYEEYVFKPADIENFNFGLDEHGERFRYPTTLTTERFQLLQQMRSLENAIATLHNSSDRLARRRQLLRYRQLYRESATRREALTYTTDFRRLIYERNLRARPLHADRYREATAAFFQANQAMTYRLVPWLLRELRAVLGNANMPLIRQMISLILEQIKRVEINSEEFRQQLQQHFGLNTDHFVHEFYCFARSPAASMAIYDRDTQYDSMLPVDVPGVSGSNEAITIPESPPRDIAVPSTSRRRRRLRTGVGDPQRVQQTMRRVQNFLEDINRLSDRSWDSPIRSLDDIAGDNFAQPCSSSNSSSHRDYSVQSVTPEVLNVLSSPERNEVAEISFTQQINENPSINYANSSSMPPNVGYSPISSISSSAAASLPSSPLAQVYSPVSSESSINNSAIFNSDVIFDDSQYINFGSNAVIGVGNWSSQEQQTLFPTLSPSSMNSFSNLSPEILNWNENNSLSSATECLRNPSYSDMDDVEVLAELPPRHLRQQDVVIIDSDDGSSANPKINASIDDAGPSWRSISQKALDIYGDGNNSDSSIEILTETNSSTATNVVQSNQSIFDNNRAGLQTPNGEVSQLVQKRRHYDSNKRRSKKTSVKHSKRHRTSSSSSDEDKTKSICSGHHRRKRRRMNIVHESSSSSDEMLSFISKGCHRSHRQRKHNLRR